MNNQQLRRFESHPQFQYCQNVRSFEQARFAYYLSTKWVSNDDAAKILLRDRAANLLLPYTRLELAKSVKRLERFRPDVVIVTATYNRLKRLERLYESIATQRFEGRVAWVIVENGSTDGTVPRLLAWSREHSWITCLPYKSAFGYATPTRNRGLAFVQTCLYKNYKETFVWVVDSDDYIYDENVLNELYSAAKRHKAVMTHGYAVVRYEDNKGNLLTTNTIPRNIGRSFPAVPSLKDELEMGPQVLSAFLPALNLRHFHYPDEFTMEDDTLNRRIMAYSFKHRLRIQTIRHPCLLKTFHADSMTNINNIIGRQDIEVQLGPKTVRGIRAQVVLGLQYVRDYFTRERI